MRPVNPFRSLARAAVPALLLAVAALLGPVRPAAAQDDAIDCRSARSATVFAICSSARLTELQNRAASEYQAMVGRIGLEAARPLARQALARRDTCGGDAACIETRLTEAIGLFLGLAEPPVSDPSILEPVIVAPLDAPNPLSPPASQAPGLGPTVPPSSYPVGPDGVLLLPTVTVPPTGFLNGLTPEDRLAYGPPVEVPGTAQRLRPPPPLEGAFKDLPEDRRIAIQVRLTLAGLGGAPDGVWGPVTQGAIEAAAEQARGLGRTVDLATPEGVADFLRYIESPDFETDILDRL